MRIVRSTRSMGSESIVSSISTKITGTLPQTNTCVRTSNSSRKRWKGAQLWGKVRYGNSSNGRSYSLTHSDHSRITILSLLHFQGMQNTGNATGQRCIFQWQEHGRLTRLTRNRAVLALTGRFHRYWTSSAVCTLVRASSKMRFKGTDEGWLGGPSIERLEYGDPEY